jgi:hypothetical protein
VVGLFREAQRWRVVLVLVDLPVLAFFFFFFFSVGSFGFGCAAPLACLLYRGCYIDIAGRKPISRKVVERSGSVYACCCQFSNLLGDILVQFFFSG